MVIYTITVNEESDKAKTFIKFLKDYAQASNDVNIENEAPKSIVSIENEAESTLVDLKYERHDLVTEEPQMTSNLVSAESGHIPFADEPKEIKKVEERNTHKANSMKALFMGMAYV